MEAASAYEILEEFVNNFVAKHGSRLQKSKAHGLSSSHHISSYIMDFLMFSLNFSRLPFEDGWEVDEIVVKVGIGSGDSRKQTLRLTASSMTGA